MEFSKYKEYKEEDFLNDEYFVDHILTPSVESTEFWNTFVLQYPGKAECVSISTNLVHTYRLQDKFENGDRMDAVWGKINDTLLKEPVIQQHVFSLYSFMRIAAVLFLVSSIGIGYWYFNTDKQITTAFGEIKTVGLPDHSVVTLNGNSSIRYARNWKKGPREVWIDGEALFNVKHINKDTLHILASERFIVHSREIDIEVLGTVFNVRNRHEQTKVGLLSGKIRIDFAENEASSPSLIMKPGDYIEHDSKRALLRKKLADPVKLSEWTKHQLFFNSVTLGEIAQTMEDDLGYHITLSDPNLASLKIEGEINVSNVKELLEIISSTLHVTIKVDEKKITIINNTN